MRIKQISVTGLFGMFDHIIPLKMEDRITIIYGLNGVGKTIILKMLNGLFNLRYSEFRNIPFNNFIVDFDNNGYIRVNKQQIPIEGEDKHQITFFIKEDSNSQEKRFVLDKLDPKELAEFSTLIRILDEIVPGLERIGPRRWLYSPTKEILTFEDAIERFSDFLPDRIRLKNNPEWLDNLRENINIRFIEYDRLLKFVDVDNRKSRKEMIPAVTTYAQEIAESIIEKITEYGKLSQSLDRTFPARVVQQELSDDLIGDELLKKLEELEKKRDYLITTGLLDKEESQNFIEQDKIDESTQKLLSVYVKDVESKLKIFEELAQKIELFKRIINHKLSYKEININKDNGFTLTTENGYSLYPVQLSSGEQHELIILYELLFKAQPNSLVLIDEPEISLHVEWQVHFLKDLQEITQIAGIDVLIATHSPDIINGQWDLTVELKGTQK